jgi:hypothetical protein
MKCFITIVLICLIIGPTSAQKYDYTWVLGYWPITGSDPDSNIGFTVIPFKTGLDYMYYKLGEGSMSNTNSLICDPETGDLLFYFDGCRVYNREFEIMENGDSLFHGPWWTEWCETGSKSYVFRNNGIALPVTIDEKINYFLPHFRDTITATNGYNKQLNYLRVDFSENPLGVVVEKSIPVHYDSTVFFILDAVRHVDGNSWWLFTVSLRHDFVKYLLTQDGMYFHSTQKMADYSRHSINGGFLRFSPDGSKLALTTRDHGTHLMDFDRSTGALSNLRVWTMPDTNFTFTVMAEFSPNSRLLYITNRRYLWQVDTWQSDLDAGTIEVGEWDGFVVGGFFSTSFCQPRLAPDCKLYMGTCGTTRFIHVIHHPDLPGHACGFEQRGIELISVNGRTMPLLPNYRLGTGPVCDPSLATSTTSPIWVETVELHIRPNPASGEVWVSLPESPPGGRLSVYDMAGREVYHHTWPGEQHTFYVGGWPPGLYFLNYYSPEGKYASGKLVVH